MLVLLAVGSAPCLYDDVQAALELYPDAEMMLINGACTAYRNAEHMLAGHTNKVEEWAAARREKFPREYIRVHANWRTDNEKAAAPLLYPSVTDWWGPGMSTGATSAGKAARIGVEMGYGRVILCGCPLDPVGYFDGEAQTLHDCERIGRGDYKHARVLRRYREKMAILAAREPFKSKVFSMSGYTKEVLGSPF